MESLGEKLKRCREAVGVTQRQVAGVLDVTVTTVQNWESGRHIPRLTLHQTKALCDLLKVTLEDLVG
ncbi:helix-turn-helix transcriptional regulator [Thermoleptolyngbya sp.]|jgi:putative transcriptional regulator